MCGVLDAAGGPTDRMVVGYREATARASSPLAPQGARVVGYKHHRSSLTPRAGSTPAWSWSGGAPEGFVWRRVHASFLTLHWAGAPDIAPRLAAAAAPAPQTTGPMPPASMPPGVPAPAAGPMSSGAGPKAAPIPAQAGTGYQVGAPVVPGSPSGVPVVPGSPGSVSLPPGSPAATPPAHAVPAQAAHGEAGYPPAAHAEAAFARHAHAQAETDPGMGGTQDLVAAARAMHAPEPSASGGYGAAPPSPGSMDDTDATMTALKGPTQANPTTSASVNGDFAPATQVPSSAQASPAGAGGEPFVPSGRDAYPSSGADPFAPPGGDPFGSRGGDPFGPSRGDPFASPGGDPFASPGGDPFAASAGDPFERSLGERFAAAGPDPFMTPADSYPAPATPQAGSAAEFGERVQVEYRGDAEAARAAADAAPYPPVSGDHGEAGR
jgi:cobyrinic acid a,c-diamide synthase